MKRIIKSWLAVLGVLLIMGCITQPSKGIRREPSINGSETSKLEKMAAPSTNETTSFGSSKKYFKHGISIVYLTGTPYEIGFAHGKLCKREIEEVNQPFFKILESLEPSKHSQWMNLARKLEENIPEEYIEEMRGISAGSDIEYDKILFLNTLSTISEGQGCFAFAFKNRDSRIFTIRQIDGYKNSHLYKKMMLYIVKPQKGFGFAAMLIPGWIDGETGMNEKGITVSQNNSAIKQNSWDVMPITHLSRYMLQYSKTIDDVDLLLDGQEAFPARLIFVSSRESASAFEFANEEKARINMENGFLALSNHARQIPSKNMSRGSVKRLAYANEFLSEHNGSMDIKTALELVRSARISRSSFWDHRRIHNRQSFVFSPSTLDFWIAIPPKADNTPACFGSYIGFNLRHELYGNKHRPSPVSFPEK
jgi:predicted choloylglycine hydrolase